MFSCSMQALSCNMWDLVPWPGIEPRLPALGAWRLSHWAIGKSLRLSLNAGNSQILISKANLLSFQTHFQLPPGCLHSLSNSPCPKRNLLKYPFFLCIPFPILYVFWTVFIQCWLHVSHLASARGIRKNKARHGSTPLHFQPRGTDYH